MHDDELGKALVRGRWPRVVAAAVGAALLVPIPALALTFLTPTWRVIGALTSHTRGAPAGEFVGGRDLRVPAGLDAFVQVNLGVSNAPVPATSVVTIERAFRADSDSGERLVVFGALDTVFENASYGESVTIGHFQRGVFRVDQSASLLSGSVGNTPVRVARVGKPFISRRLRRARGRTYFLRLTFVYTKGGNGFWHDNAPQPASVHRFRRRPA